MGSNGSKNGKGRIPWNKGKKGAEVGAGGKDSPWNGNGGPDRNQGRRPGDLNAATVELGQRTSTFRRALTDRLAIEQFAAICVREILAGSAPHAKIYRDAVCPAPKQIELTGAEGFAPGTAFRCFLSDGRPLPASAVPVSNRTPPRS